VFCFAVLLDRLTVFVFKVVPAMWCFTCALLVFSSNTKQRTFRCVREKKKGKRVFKKNHHEFVGIFFVSKRNYYG
jgi:hypothetical protein